MPTPTEKSPEDNIPTKPWAEILVSIAPTLLWVLLAGFVLILYHDSIRSALDRAGRIKIGIVELEVMVKTATEKVTRVPELSEGHIIHADDPLRKSLARRLQSIHLEERPIRVLLIHDKFSVAKALREPFEDLGFSVDIGICPQEAESLLRRHRYDVVISDIRWQTCPNLKDLPSDGIEFLQRAVAGGFDQPTVFFIGNYKPERGTPAHAVGITNNWYAMLHFVLDALSRKPPG